MESNGTALDNSSCPGYPNRGAPASTPRCIGASAWLAPSASCRRRGPPCALEPQFDGDAPSASRTWRRRRRRRGDTATPARRRQRNICAAARSFGTARPCVGAAADEMSTERPRAAPRLAWELRGRAPGAPEKRAGRINSNSFQRQSSPAG